jgi:hypothetical protein
MILPKLFFFFSTVTIMKWASVFLQIILVHWNIMARQQQRATKQQQQHLIDRAKTMEVVRLYTMSCRGLATWLAGTTSEIQRSALLCDKKP